MQSNMTMNSQVMYMMMMEVAWQYTRNGYGNAIIGRYGGCFEEGIYGGFMVPAKVARY